MKYLKFILLMISPSLFSISYNEYPMSLLGEINVGTADYELGYDDTQGYIYSGGPKSFALDESGDIYLSDTHNKRIVIYDENLIFKKVLEVDKESTIYFSSNLEIRNDRIYGRDQESTFYIISKQGINEFQYSFWNTDEFEQLQNQKYIWFESLLFHYLKNGELIAIERSNDEYIVHNLDEINSMITNDVDKFQNISINSEAGIFYNGRLQTRDFLAYVEKLNINSIHANGFSNEIFLKMKNNKYIGADAEGNEYWQVGSKRIIIFSYEGNLIDSIAYDPRQSSSTPVIHPHGSIYFMKSQRDKIIFSKIDKTW